MKNPWINSRILNRSGLAERLWPDERISANKLRRRLEHKAERGNLTMDEKKKIEEEILLLYSELKAK